jgi:hypothetical protein
MKIWDLKYFLLLPILFGCASSPAGENTYLPVGEAIKTEAVNDQVDITWIRFEDPEKLRKECENLGLKAKKGMIIAACASFNLEKKICKIYALNPKTLNDERTTLLGHETKHCFDGKYHD